jgi:hypothetical protein
MSNIPSNINQNLIKDSSFSNKNNINSNSNEIILYDSKNEKYTPFTRIISGFIIFQGIIIYGLSLILLWLIFSQSKILISIFTLIIIYQFLFCKRSDNWRRILKYFRPQLYFRSFKLIAEEELKENKCLYSFHPHGVLSLIPPTVCAVNETLFKCRFLVSRVLLNFPLSGVFARILGGEAVEKNNFGKIMKEGENIIFMPGGFEEATITDFDKNKIFIKNRIGFIKYALNFGYSIHPCYTFNENKLFYNMTLFENFRLFMASMKFPAVFFCSKLGIMPHYDLDITVVIGKSINLPKIENPTENDILKYHKVYIDSLIDLYYRHTNKYGDGEKLIIY